MPLYRRHCGSLTESLAKTVIVKNKDDLRKVILSHWIDMLDMFDRSLYNFNDFNIKIEIPYGLKLENSFDPMIGWYTHMVLADHVKKGGFLPVGWLSEPME